MHLKKYNRMAVALVIILAVSAAGAFVSVANHEASGRSVGEGYLVARSLQGSHHRAPHYGLGHRDSGLGLRGGRYDRGRTGPYDGPRLARHYEPYRRTARHYRPYPRVARHYRPYPRLSPHYRPYGYGGHPGPYIRPYPGSYYRVGPDRRGYYFFYFSLPYRRYTYNYRPYYYGRKYPQRPRDYPYYEKAEPYDREPTLPEQAQQNIEDSKITQHLGSVAEAFAEGDYEQAVKRALKAVEAAPESSVLPFVYSQSLFAAGRYDKAAAVLRKAVLGADLETQGVFFPAGFYADRQTWAEQIAELEREAGGQRDAADLQLLLGYQLLGAGSYDQAQEAFEQAERDYVNKDAAARLKYVLEETQKTELEGPPYKE